MLCKFVLLALTAASSPDAPAKAPVPAPNAEGNNEPPLDAGATAVKVPESNEEIEAKDAAGEDKPPKEGVKVAEGKASGGSGNAISKTEEDVVESTEEVIKDMKDAEENVVSTGATDATETNAPEVAGDSTETKAPEVAGNSTDDNPASKTGTEDESTSASMATLFVAALVSFAF